MLECQVCQHNVIVTVLLHSFYILLLLLPRYLVKSDFPDTVASISNFSMRESNYFWVCLFLFLFFWHLVFNFVLHYASVCYLVIDVFHHANMSMLHSSSETISFTLSALHPNDIYALAVLSDSKPQSSSEGCPQSTVFPSGYEVRTSL